MGAHLAKHPTSGRLAKGCGAGPGSMGRVPFCGCKVGSTGTECCFSTESYPISVRFDEIICWYDNYGCTSETDPPDGLANIRNAVNDGIAIPDADWEFKRGESSGDCGWWVTRSTYTLKYYSDSESSAPCPPTTLETTTVGYIGLTYTGASYQLKQNTADRDPDGTWATISTFRPTKLCCPYDWVEPDLCTEAVAGTTWESLEGTRKMDLENNRCCKCSDGSCAETSSATVAECNVDDENDCTASQDDDCP